MSEQQQEQASWERLPGENELWYGRFWCFVQAGSSRKLLDIVHAEEARKGKKRQSKSPSGAWSRIAEQHQWKKRAEAYDEAERTRVEAQKQAYIDSILQEGYALVHERIKALSAVAHQLEGYMGDENRVWLADVKIVATGMGKAERVDLKVFNDNLFTKYLETMTDIAEEVGGRVKKQEVNNKGNPLAAVNVHVFLPD